MKELDEIREKIKKSENPLILFDDDPDGLCSYLLIRKFMGKGKGIAVRGEPFVDSKYVGRVKVYCPDLIIILDKPMIKDEFLDKMNAPIIWIDHHEPQNVKGVTYFNPRIKDDKDNRPVSYWCYRIVKENLWIAFVGIIADYFLILEKSFRKEYPDLIKEKTKTIEEIYYGTKVGELIRIFSNILKGKMSDVNRNIELITKIKDPYELLDKKSDAGDELVRKHEKIQKDFDKLVKEATKNVKGNIIKFMYADNKYSFSSELSNYLSHKFPNKVILVCRDKGDKITCSIRSKKKSLPEIVNESVEGLDGYGGGHQHACGACISKEDFDEFYRRFEEKVK